jgi:hypothetical protein
LIPLLPILGHWDPAQRRVQDHEGRHYAARGSSWRHWAFVLGLLAVFLLASALLVLGVTRTSG